MLNASAPLSPHFKKRRLSLDDEEKVALTAVEEIDGIRRSLARLEDRLGSQHDQTPATWSHHTSSQTFASALLPNRLEKIDELVNILPCQSDCETLFEYVIQEADWVVSSIGVQWLQPIWSRFVYGARVTVAESMVLVAVLAVAALLLEEGPHIYYQTTCPLGPLQVALTDYMFNYIASFQTSSKAHLSNGTSPSSPHNSLDEFLVLAMAFDYLRLSGARTPERWPLVRCTLYQMERNTPLLNKNDLFWQRLDEMETEYARRIVWHFILCERWGDLYENQNTSSPFCNSSIDIEKPRWICSSLSAPFRASRSSNTNDEAITMRPSLKSVTRIFRIKDEQEVDQVPVIAQLLTELSTHVSAASSYISLIEVWRKNGRKSVSDAYGNQIDHQREALLHQSIVICENIRKWQNRIKPYCSEPETLDVNDYLACRRASQAAIIHVGRRQILSAVLGAWVTEESIMEVGSPLLAQQQREAFQNARDAVKTIEVTKALLSCAKIVQIPWATLAFFTAATTLAIPLLAASRLRRDKSTITPRVFRMDHLHAIERMTSDTASQSITSSSPRAALAALPFYPSNGAPIPAPSVLDLEEMRTLAPDILLILELMPNYRPSFLSVEARQRLVKLVDTYGINHNHTLNQPLRDSVNGEASPLNLNLSHDLSEPKEASEFSVLDSLLALDDFWWEQLLSSNDQTIT